MVIRVLSNSNGYVHNVELIPAKAPATREGGTGIFKGCSGLGVNIFLTVSYANNWKEIDNNN